MITELERKLTEDQPSYQDQEVAWLLAHIGDPDAVVRDDIVYATFATGLKKGSFTPDQFRFLVAKTLEKDLLFYRLDQDLPATLTRTFTALLCALLIQVDGKSPFYQGLMTESQRQSFFDAASAYLEKENDFTGYVEPYEWVHAFAHGGDFLRNCLLHPDFPEANQLNALKAISGVFLRLPAYFVTGEERRLAAAVYQPLLQGYLSQETVVRWLDQVHFPIDTLTDRMRLACFENFLAALYFHVVEQVELTPELKDRLMRYLRDY